MDILRKYRLLVSTYIYLIISRLYNVILVRKMDNCTTTYYFLICFNKSYYPTYGYIYQVIVVKSGQKTYLNSIVMQVRIFSAQKSTLPFRIYIFIRTVLVYVLICSWKIEK